MGSLSTPNLVSKKTLSQRTENYQDMRESYLMIDPSGRFFQNSPIAEQGYAYSQPILEVGADAAFAEVHFTHERFSSRYALDVRGETV